MSERKSLSKTPGAASGPELDISKLHSLSSEQQELYILTFSAALVRDIEGADAKDISARHPQLKKELFNILTLSSPAVTRVVRNNIGRSFACLFSSGDGKGLYETVKELLDILSAGKAESELRTKHAAAHCLGEIFRATGEGARSQSTLAVLAIYRLIKPAQNNAGLRSSLFRALGKIAGRLGDSLDEALLRDVWKSARVAASTDKSLLAQKSALWCLEQLIRTTSSFDDLHDFESLKTATFKALDSPAASVRHAAASTFAAALVKYFSGETSVHTVSKQRKAKKTSRKEPAEFEESQDAKRSESPGPKKQATRTTLSLLELLRQLAAQYTRSSTSNRTRAGLAACYCCLFKTLGREIVEGQYMRIADHLFNDILSHPVVTSNRYRLLISRKFVRVILENIVGQEVLGETAQLNAARALVNDVLKNYPQVIKERPEPTKHAIAAALSALTTLLKDLGSAANGLADACRDGLLQVLEHPSYTVQICTSYCLRTFVLVCPQELLSCVTVCINSVKREVGLLKSPRHSHRKCVGYANGLASMLSTGPERPVYCSMDVNLGVLSLANELLKSSGGSELRVSATQIQVAWILMGGLMSFGPVFVKKILPRLFFLWKNALPRPLSKAEIAQRSPLELSFLAHVRECALGCLLAFLECNSKLLTADLVRRIAGLLQNTTLFLNHLPSKKNVDDILQRLSPSLQLCDYELMVRRRVLQSYIRLLRLSSSNTRDTLLQPDILTLTASLFAHPDDYTSGSLSTSIASSAGNFDSVWEIGDNHGFGVTGMLRGFELRSMPKEDRTESRHWLTKQGAEATIDETLRSPTSGAREHDSVSLYVSSVEKWDGLPDPPSTETVNAAISLFAVSLPLQSTRIQESILEQLATFISSSILNRDPGRKAAVTANVAVALLATLKVASRETDSAPGDLTDGRVQRTLQNLLEGLVVHPDVLVRNVASEALGRLCSIAGNSFTANVIKQLIDTIVSNREPNARAGCAAALGCIHAQVGGMAAGYHLKTIFGVLLSLSDDPHPLVHFWALDGLSKVADSAGLTFSGFVSSALGMLAQRYVSDTHNAEIPPSAASNMEVEFSATAAIARCLDSLINVLGPDLQDVHKVCDLIITLASQLQDEDDAQVVIGTLRCFEHISTYAAERMDFTGYVRKLQTFLKASPIDTREAAIDGLYSLVKRDAEHVLEATNAGFEDQIWMALDQSPTSWGLRRIVSSWLQQTCLSSIGYWIEQCQRLMKQSRSEPEPGLREKADTFNTQADMQDEEVAGFAAASANDRDASSTTAATEQELLKWQVRAFALDCLSELLGAVGKAMVSSDEDISAGTELQLRVGEVIRIAFSASTSHVVDLRIRGIFGKSSDPDFPEASLLDQYQAQISSALTPAFAADSSPELAADAIEVCAGFIGTGIITRIDRMGRILRLLVSALADFTGPSDTAAIGDLKGLGPNAQVMVRTAVISAWAGLQVARKEQQYLDDVVKPHINLLAPLWLSSLKEFARIRFAPDDSLTSSSSPLSSDGDFANGDLDRQTLIQFYKNSWLEILDAIASLIREDIGFVFDALDDKAGPEPSKAIRHGNGINYRDEPVAFFFVLFGITVEALLTKSTRDADTVEDEILRLLAILRIIIRPSVSGHAIYQEAVFSETIDLMNRLVMTQGLEVQTIVVDIASDLCGSHPSSRSQEGQDGDAESLSEDIEQLFELTRIVVTVLTSRLPTLADSGAKGRPEISEDEVSLLRASLGSLVGSAQVFPSVIKTDLYACIFHIFTTMLGTAACQPAMIPQALPILKQFVQDITTRSGEASVDDFVVAQLRCCLRRFLAIYANAQKRETTASLACVKNTLLASTILLTGSTNVIPAEDASVQRLLDDLVECLDDRMTTSIAVHCIRSLLLGGPRIPADENIVRTFVPRLARYMTSAPDHEDPANARGRVCQAMTSFVGTLSAARIPLGLRFVVPALIQNASFAAGVDQRKTHQQAAARLLELAALDQTSFKSIVGGMDRDQRGKMEAIVRQGSGRGRRRRAADGHDDDEDDEDDDDEGDDDDDDDDNDEDERVDGIGPRKRRQAEGSQPSIALKMNFGG